MSECVCVCVCAMGARVYIASLSHAHAGIEEERVTKNGTFGPHSPGSEVGRFSSFAWRVAAAAQTRVSP